MDELTIGDFMIIEIALCQFVKDLDLSMSVGQQVQQLVGKIEMNVNRLNEAEKTRVAIPAGPEATLTPGQ